MQQARAEDRVDVMGKQEVMMEGMVVVETVAKVRMFKF